MRGGPLRANNRPREHVSITDADMVGGDNSQREGACHCFVEEVALRFRFRYNGQCCDVRERDGVATKRLEFVRPYVRGGLN